MEFIVFDRRRLWLLKALPDGLDAMRAGRKFFQRSKWPEIHISGDPESRTLTVSTGLDEKLAEVVEDWAERRTECKDVINVLGVLYITFLFS